MPRWRIWRSPKAAKQGNDGGFGAAPQGCGWCGRAHPGHFVRGVAGLQFGLHGVAKAGQLVHMLVAVDKVWRRAHGLLEGVQLLAPGFAHLRCRHLPGVGIANHRAKRLRCVRAAMVFRQIEVQAD